MKNVFGTERLAALLKCLMAAYLITGLMLLLVAGLLYKFSIGENVVDISIIVIYCISSLLAGLFFLQGCGEPQVYMGNAGGRGVFSDYLCGLCRGRSGICANQQHLYHDTFDLSGQWYAGRNDGVAPTALQILERKKL